MTTFADFIAFDDRLAAKGVPPLSSWWRDEARRYFDSGVLDWTVCAGRGAAKSTALYKLACCETLVGDFAIPPGERHWASITSRAKDEASKALGILSGWLRLLGVAHAPTNESIELSAIPRGIRITAASVGANTGWRSFFDGADELGKWTADGAVAFDAREVMASKRAMTATHARARRMVTSTPFLDEGVFYDLVQEGDNDRQVVSGPAATWVAAPHIPEELTRRLEPNARIWAREYGASFVAAWSDGFFGGLVQPCVKEWTSRPYAPGFGYVIAIDPAFAKDLFAICVAHVEERNIVVDLIEAIVPPGNGRGLSPTQCMRRVRSVADSYHARHVLTDQHHAASLVEIAASERVYLEPIAWTASSKKERFNMVRDLMLDRRIALPNDHGLLRELASIGTKLRAGGGESIEARRGSTDDRVAALVLAASSTAAAAASRGARMIEALQSWDVGAAAGGLGGLREHPQFDQFMALADASRRQR